MEKFNANNNKSKTPVDTETPEKKDTTNTFGLSKKELDDLYSDNDNSEMYKK